MAERRFTRVTSKEQLLALAKTASEDLPQSATIHNAVLMHTRNCISSLNFFVLNDQPDSHVLMWQMKNSPSDVSFSCREDEVDHMIMVLKKTSQIDWLGHLNIYHVPHYLEKPMKMLAPELDISFFSNGYHTFTYNPHLDDDPLRCGPGFSVRRLGKAGLQHLLNMSLYSKHLPLETMWKMTEYLPAVGVYLDSSVTEDRPIDLQHLSYAGNEEIPVSWVSSTFYGSLGMLGTHKSYRRKGLGSLIITVVARLYTRLGFISHCHVGPNNIPSKAMFNKMPAWEDTHSVTWLRTP